MSEIIIICLAALITSLLTFFSGFGLGTILLPVFAIFFPVDLAIALTGIVHFLNNIFKLSLVGLKADWHVVLRFGVPAFLAALLGAFILLRISDLQPIYTYHLWSREYAITPVKLIIAVLLILFSLMEVMPYFKNLQFGKDKLIIGGILSGFFGGLSGHQGALRSAFLIKSGLTKEAFIATGIVIACIVDFSRLGVYITRFSKTGLHENLTLVIAATASAFIGAYIGSKLLKKVTMGTVQLIVIILLILISIALGLGIV
ncbi:MAG: sulfite exporter TauE/SafE family protein [Cytophagales bacterium]|nr:sulfite exporter TauE/SafE family protein [Cytophagales bacterium]